MRVDIFTSIKGKLVYIYVYHLALSLILSILHGPKKSDWNSAYERREMKVLINVWKCILKAASELDNAISLGSLFHSVIVLV